MTTTMMKRQRIRRERRAFQSTLHRGPMISLILHFCGILLLLLALSTHRMARAFTLSSPVPHRFFTQQQSSSLQLFALRNRKRRKGRGADIEQEEEELKTPATPAARLPKRNEIDYCIAPADASLARAGDSLTRTLNNASNRVVRRILLLLSWPGDADSLNRRLTGTSARARSEAAYVKDQLEAFAERYSTMTGYAFAEEYLQCILALAMQQPAVAPPPVERVLQAGIYDEAYQRVLAVLARAGVVVQRRQKNQKDVLVLSDMQLQDRDICWSLWDKVQMRKEEAEKEKEDNGVVLKDEATKTVNGQESPDEESASPNGESSPKPRKKRNFLFRKSPASPPKGILLSSQKEEPTVTRQLNVISNIVQRALLFGGDEELLFWIDALQEDRPAFIDRWGGGAPALAYFDSLIALLQACYKDRSLTTLEPFVPLPSVSYANAYERLVATAVESGSGYWKPATTADIPAPRTPKEELGRFALWETRLRKEDTSSSSNPDDLVGTWQVRDQVGDETIGTCTVEFRSDGKVETAVESLQGVRWQLDPGPTHLDTCTFSVLTLDGNLLLYRGFLDRGARWEARYSKRSLQIRGSVMFQMRDGADQSYYQDMVLPINYRTGTTKFSMTKTTDASLTTSTTV